MSMFSFFRRLAKSTKRKPSKPFLSKATLIVEALEDRTLPSTASISGFVFADANNNGLFDPGETPIASAAVQLRDANNNILGNTTTDANGFYQFSQDASVNQAPLTITKTLTFPSTQTDYTLPGSIAQFDPSLGQLQSVEITHNGSITSDIKVENTSPLAPSSISGTVGGSLELTGPGVDSVLTMSQNAGSFNASAFDSTLDYGGTSGTDFGAKTATGTKTVTLTGSDMAAYLGTGQVAFTENAHASSYAAGGGNLNVSLGSSGMSTVTVVYSYVPSNALKAGTYSVVQTVQPTGYIDGKESSGGVVLSHQPNVDVIPITLDGTNSSTNNDFGKLQPAGISGYVYFDANNNGIMDAGEAGISGVQITLTGTNINGPVTATALSDAHGFYQFPGLVPGTYTLKETQPSNYLDGKTSAGSLGGTVTDDQIAAINLPSAGTSAGNDFGELKPSSLSGYVYADANNNGVMDPGEAPIAGSTITLTGTNDQGTVSQTATTDANGYYQFANLRPGTYTLQQDEPANWLDGKDTAGSLGGSVSHDQIANINLASGAAGSNNDFGELHGTNVSGYVYFDANNNGVKDAGESPIAGSAITLTGTNDQGAVSQTATTDANGFYQFANLRPGTYTLQQDEPAGWLDGKDTAGSLGGSVSHDQIANINLASGATSSNNNFGELKGASLSGYVYVDANNNGARDAGEAPVAGDTITLTGADTNGPVSQTATTDANGFYQFTNLRPGTYTITQTPPANYFDGMATIGSQGGSAAADVLSNINLASGVAGVNNNFGELTPAGLSGYVYVDANNNGVKDAGEAPIAGDTITLTGADTNGPVSQTATTDANGFYQFTNLRTGTYTLTQTPPPNYLDGKDTIGSQGGTAGNHLLGGITLGVGVQGVNNDFGELLPGGLSGFVYIDTNNNGVKDPGESGFAGAKIALTGFTDQGPINQTAITDANGFYQFQNLRPGTYALTETNTSTYLDGKDTIGSQGGTTGTDNFSSIVLASGVLGVNNNFGLLPPANADLGIVKTASASSVLVGSTITYTLTVTNYGTSTAQSVQVIDTLPPDAIYQNANGTGWTVSQTGGTITATLPSLAANAVSQITVTVKAPAVADTLTNTATVSSVTPDSNPTNNTSTVTTTVFNQPGTSFPQGIVPLVTAFGRLPALGKIQLFGVDPTPYINPVLLNQMTFVSGAYETVMGRAPSYNEFAAALAQLQSGVATATIASALWNSDAHRAQQANALYETFLGRAATAAELAGAVQALKTGTSEINFALGLVNSAEYQTSHPTPGTLVAGLYANILNEVPDASTQLQAVSALANESVSALALSLMTSAPGLSTIVNDAYLAILRRAASQAEIQTWVAQLQNNQVSLDQMQIDLLASPEFYQLAARSTSTV